MNAQSVFAASERVPHPFVIRAKGAVTVMLVIGTAAIPLFNTDTDCGSELFPTATGPKLIFAGLNATLPVLIPVPDRLTVIDPACTLPEIVKWPDRVPVCKGENTTWIEQFAPGATVAFAQLSVSVKSPEGVNGGTKAG